MARSTSRGGQALQAYIDRNYPREHKDHGSVSAFAADKGLDRVQVLRVLNGTRGLRMGVKLAAAIEAATDGEVSMAAWAEDIDDEKGAA